MNQSRQNRILGALLSIGVGTIVTISGCGKPVAVDAKPPSSGASSVQVATAQLRTIRYLLSMPGSFVPAQGASANLTASTTGRISKILVKEGEKVTKGQLLAVLDTGVQAAQVQSATEAASVAAEQALQAQLAATAALKNQQTSLASAQAALQAAKAQDQADVTTARVNLSTAQAELNKIKAGARPQELAQAHQAVVAAQAAANKSQKDEARIEQLSHVGYASKQQLDDAKAAVQSMEAALASSKAQESLLKAGARSEDRIAAEQRVAGAKAELEATKQLGNQRILQAEANLAQAKAGQLTVQQQQSAAAAAQAMLRQKQAEATGATASAALNQIRAPFNGTIVRRMLNAGDLADPTTTVLQLVSSSKTDFVGTITASQADKIKAGMETILKPDGTEQTTGNVLSVSTADPSTGVVRVRIACNSDIVPGATGNAQVVVRVDSNVVAVPNDAIIQRDGQTMVFLAKDGTANQVIVDLGPQDGNYTEIPKGIIAGDIVIRLGQFELDDGAKIKIADPSSALKDPNPANDTSTSLGSSLVKS